MFFMTRPKYEPTYIRQWREKSGLTLQELAVKLREEAGFETTKTSLSRIERGLQPYSQAIIEAIGKVLDVKPAGALILRDPNYPDVASVFDRIDDPKKPDAIKVLEALATPRDKAGGV
jgi:transcriptional regulator with XRE-family HTH domain